MPGGPHLQRRQRLVQLRLDLRLDGVGLRRLLGDLGGLSVDLPLLLICGALVLHDLHQQLLTVCLGLGHHNLLGLSHGLHGCHLRGKGDGETGA
jgi:hypothetical protein